MIKMPEETLRLLEVRSFEKAIFFSTDYNPKERVFIRLHSWRGGIPSLYSDSYRSWLLRAIHVVYVGITLDHTSCNRR